MADQSIGKVVVVYGTVKAQSADGVERVLGPNSPIFLNDRINTGPDGAISIVFSNPENTQLDLGRMTDMVIDNSVVGTEEVDLGEVTAEVAAIQEALESGEEIEIAETAAGPAAGGAGQGGGGRPIYRDELDGNEGEVTSGAETESVPYGFTGTLADLAVEPQDPVVFIPPPPEPVSVEEPEPELVSFAAEAGTTPPPVETTPPPPVTTLPPEDDEPSAESATLTVDEDGFRSIGNPGTPYSDGLDEFPDLLEVDSNLTYDFGENGPSATTPFTWLVDELQTDLSTAGANIFYELSSDGLTLIAHTGDPEIEDDRVFVLTLNDIESGGYSFRLLRPLDHDSVNTEDNIPLNFGYTIQDADGDTATSNLEAIVNDDSPVVAATGVSVDETAGVVDDVFTQVTDTGTITALFGADGQGVTALNIVGNDGGSWDSTTSTYTGPGGAYTLVFDLDAGTYAYTQTAALDHPDGSNPDDLLSYNFTATVTDGDGDEDTADFSLTVNDDGPSVAATGVSVDETAGVVDDVFTQVTDTGTITALFGADGQGVTALNIVGNDGGSWDSTTSTYTGPGGAYTLVFDLDAGTYAYTQTAALDHPDGSNPDDLLSYNFTATVTDGDGDEDTADFSLTVNDDGPSVAATGVSVDETAGVVDDVFTQVTDTGTITALFGADGQGVTALNIVGNDGGSWDSTTSTYTGPGGAYTLVFDLDAGTYAYTQTAALDHPDGSNPDDLLSYNFTATVTDGDGDEDTADFSLTVNDDGPSVAATGVSVDETAGVVDDVFTQVTDTGTITALFGADGQGVTALNIVGNDGGSWDSTTSTYTGPGGAYTLVFDLDAGTYAYTQTAALDHPDGSNPDDLLSYNFTATVTDGDGDEDTADFSLTVNDDGPSVAATGVSVDETAGVVDDVFTQVTDTGTITALFGADGQGVTALNIVGNDGGSWDSTTSTYTGPGGAYTLVFDLDAGTYAYTQTAALDHPDGSNPDDLLSYNFTATVTDGDGDEDTADFSLTVNDDGPSVAATGVSVDETAGVVDDVFTQVTDTGTITALFGADGQGVTALNIVGNDGGSWDSTTSTYTGPGGAYTLVFDLDAGTYAYTQTAALDHPDGSNPDDLLSYNFTATVTDGDGDEDTADFSLTVNDDGPSVAATGVSVDETAGVVDDVFTQVTDTGTITALFGADGQGVTALNIVGNDGGSWDSTTSTYTGPGGAYTLVFDLDAGTYAYTQTAALDHPDGSNPDDLLSYNFTATVTDGDGDEDTADFSLTVNDDGPSVAATGVSVDETAGVVDDVFTQVTDTGTITALFGADGQGVTALNIVGNDGGSWDSTTSTYTGPGGAYTLVFDLDAGTYAYTQTAALDHPDGSNPDDLLSYNFTATVTDGDGDEDTADFSLTVNDDGPYFASNPQDSFLANEPGNNVVGDLNIDFGADGPNDTLALQLEGPVDEEGYVINDAGEHVTSNGGSLLVYESDGQGGLIAVTADEDAAPVFTVAVNPENGTYEVTQIAPQEIDGAAGTFVDFTADAISPGGPVNFIDIPADEFNLRISGFSNRGPATEGWSQPQTSAQGLGIDNQFSDYAYEEVLTIEIQDADTSAPELVESVSLTISDLDENTKNDNDADDEYLIWEVYNDTGLVGSGELDGEGQGASADQTLTISVDDATVSESFHTLVLYPKEPAPGENDTDYRIIDLTIFEESEGSNFAITYDVTATDGDGDSTADEFTINFDADGDIDASDSTNESGVAIAGSSEDDMIIGSDYDDTIEGGDGNDYLVGELGDDEIYGDAGDDVLIGGDGVDDLDGGTGDDILVGDTIDFGADNNDDSTIVEDGVADEIAGGADSDIVVNDQAPVTVDQPATIPDENVDADVETAYTESDLNDILIPPPEDSGIV